jgi:hypothetical protein
VSFSHQRLDGFRQPEGEADFALDVGSVALCPVRLGRALTVRPCAKVSAGATRSALGLRAPQRNVRAPSIVWTP